MFSNDAEQIALAILVALDEHELASIEIARRKLVSEPIAEFASFMQDAHSANLSDTRDLITATRATLRRDPPAVQQLVQNWRAAREGLQKIDGEAFEAAFALAMVKDHEQALKLVDDSLANARNPDVVRHLQTTRSHLADHLARARALRVDPDVADPVLAR